MKKSTNKKPFNPPVWKFINVDTSKQIRCPVIVNGRVCNRMFGKGEVKAYETKCEKCKTIVRIESL